MQTELDLGDEGDLDKLVRVATQVLRRADRDGRAVTEDELDQLLISALTVRRGANLVHQNAGHAYAQFQTLRQAPRDLPPDLLRNLQRRLSRPDGQQQVLEHFALLGNTYRTWSALGLPYTDPGVTAIVAVIVQVFPGGEPGGWAQHVRRVLDDADTDTVRYYLAGQIRGAVAVRGQREQREQVLGDPTGVVRDAARVHALGTVALGTEANPQQAIPPVVRRLLGAVANPKNESENEWPYYGQIFTELEVAARLDPTAVDALRVILTVFHPWLYPEDPDARRRDQHEWDPEGEAGEAPEFESSFAPVLQQQALVEQAVALLLLSSAETNCEQSVITWLLKDYRPRDGEELWRLLGALRRAVARLRRQDTTLLPDHLLGAHRAAVASCLARIGHPGDGRIIADQVQEALDRERPVEALGYLLPPLWTDRLAAVDSLAEVVGQKIRGRAHAVEIVSAAVCCGPGQFVGPSNLNTLDGFPVSRKLPWEQPGYVENYTTLAARAGIQADNVRTSLRRLLPQVDLVVMIPLVSVRRGLP